MPQNQPHKIHKVIGLMSGTSLDGLDIAYCHFWKNGSLWQFEIVLAETIGYTGGYRSKLKDAMQLDAVSLLAFHNEYGEWLGDQVAKFISKHQLEIDFVASHGHTVFHQPQRGLTLQIGSGQHIANRCGLPTIADFRSKDVSLGGQGAPLVPIGDHWLFSEYDFCLNLGGISNISFIEHSQRVAYDISPVNMLLGYILRSTDLPYDDGGKLARSGKLNQGLLDELNQLSFYALDKPKSLGYEWFQQEVVPVLEKHPDSLENLLHTAIHHIAEQIALIIKKAIVFKDNKSVLATGGGVHNRYLMDTLQEKLGSNYRTVPASDTLINFKEALIFAFMGVLRMENQVNCLQSVTGAKNDSCSGVVFLC